MELQTATLDPWRTIWTRPRDTVRFLVDTDPERRVLVLAAVSGASQLLDRAAFQSLGDDYSISVILAGAVVLGPVVGIIGLYFAGAMIAWTGRWLGGAADSKQVRTAVAWANVPIVAGLGLWFFDLVMFGEEVFTSYTPRLDASVSLALMLIGSGGLAVVLGVWSLVLMLQGIGEVQGFSTWKALANIVLAGAVVVAAFSVLLVLSLILIS